MSLPVENLEAGFRGELIRPEDSACDAARKVWNGMIDRRPAVIARATGTADVMAAVRFARANDLAVAVRGGGHNVAGNAVCDAGIVIDLSAMQGIRVDRARRTARAQAGATWGTYDRETQAFGLASPGGLISTTGIAGLTLGGGFGWLSRKYGLAADNLTSVDVVLADGRPVTASVLEHNDLFWGVRGGGGNFGVVTSFEYQLHLLGPLVFGGVIFHRAEHAAELLSFYRNYTADVPDEVTSSVIFLTAPPAPFLPREVHGAPLVAISAMYTGTVEHGKSALEPIRRFGRPVADIFSELPYVALQSMFDASAAPGLQNYWKSESLTHLSDGAIDAFAKHFTRLLSPFSQIHVSQLGGAVSRVDDDATAYPLRRAQFIVNIIGMWPNPADSSTQIAWVRHAWTAVIPFASGGVYINFLGDEGNERIEAAYGRSKYERLRALKQRYDPTNFFHLNQNIKPLAHARPNSTERHARFT
jgi:FAD/FMN-containing dehydrogenase